MHRPIRSSCSPAGTAMWSTPGCPSRRPWRCRRPERTAGRGPATCCCGGSTATRSSGSPATTAPRASARRQPGGQPALLVVRDRPPGHRHRRGPRTADAESATPTGPRRPGGSQLAAWASDQSQVDPRPRVARPIAGAEFEARYRRRRGAPTAPLGRLPARPRRDRVLARPHRTACTTGFRYGAGPARLADRAPRRRRPVHRGATSAAMQAEVVEVGQVEHLEVEPVGADLGVAAAAGRRPRRASRPRPFAPQLVRAPGRSPPPVARPRPRPAPQHTTSAAE